jgi:threonylcarbamoyladenosine tRNA methylthiotransferase MtaB
MTTQKQIAFHTLGCKLNQYETEALATQFRKNGYDIVDFKDQADVYIINTCTVTAKSDQKSQHSINQARKRENALVVATGCYATRSQETLEATTGVTFVVPNPQKSQIFSMVDAYLKGEIYHPSQTDLFNYEKTEGIFHTRGMIKIQDGCDNQCSFCIIPSVRGKAVSRPLEDILIQAQDLIHEGYKEIVLTGVNMSRYDWEGTRFSDVLAGILNLSGDFRVRLSSLEPENIDERFMSLLKHPKLCQHLHLCLQSASNKVLFNMHRTYNWESYQTMAKALKEHNPLLNLTTDIIVGFPGETEEDFALSAQAVRDLGMGHVHVFKYSPRTGTRAARMMNQLEEKEKDRRVKNLTQISESQKKIFYESVLGKEQVLLVEKIENNWASGYTANYIYAKIPYNGKENHFVTFTPSKVVWNGQNPFITV